MTLTPETLLQRNVNTLEASLNNGLALFDSALGVYLQVNAGAEAVWSALVMPKTIAAICAELMKTFDVSAAECLADVQELCEDLIRKKLIIISG
jgi:hypothetical protein